MQHVEYLVIGGGPAGTPAAMALASMGKSVMLVEKGPGLGGTCLFEGCIPSKIFRESARHLRELRQADRFGLCLPTRDVSVNWSAILERKRAILQQRGAAAAHKAEQLPALQTVFGTCQFLADHTAEIQTQDDKTMQVAFDHAIISTGSVPFIAPIRGSDHPRVYDSESILDIDHIPQQLVIIGGGPIGVELGQVFNTFGSKVSILEAAPHILGMVDEELVERLQQRMLDEGIEIRTNCDIDAIVHSGQRVFVEYHDDAGDARHIIADTVLMVTGRQPNVENLGLQNTSVSYDRHGIKVNEVLETADKGIFAVGDVIGQPMFAHWATAQGLALVRHLSGQGMGQAAAQAAGQAVPFPGRETNTAVIFSEPEIGIAGLSEQQARQAGLDVQVARYDYSQDARAQISGCADGLLKIVFEQDSRRVVGVHVLVEGAGELMGEAALLIKSGMPVEAIAAAIHPHPTLTESFVFAVRDAMAQMTRQDAVKEKI